METQVNSTNAIYQPLSEPNSTIRANPTTISSRIRERFTVKNLAVLGIGASVIATAIYQLVHKEATEGADDFPHDRAFAYYCKESCALLYKFNPELVQTCNEYCDGNSESTFPNACTLACNKLGIDTLLKCIQSCK